MKYWKIIKQEIFKKWIDVSSIQNVYYRIRLLYYIKFIESWKLKINIKDYSIMFEDKFETFDKDIWHTSQPWGRVHPKQDWQYSSESCINIIDNNLVLTNKYEPKSGTQWVGQEDEFDYDTTYTHGEIQLKKKYTYGIYEIKCKIPTNANVITAFWLTAHNSAELDIFEFFAKNDFKNGKMQTITIHWPTNSELKYPHDRKMSPKKFKLPLDLHKDFHTYTLIWTKEKMDFLFDGLLIRRLTNKRVMDVHNKPASLIIGNGLFPLPEIDTNLPESPYIIDYVKIWQK